MGRKVYARKPVFLGNPDSFALGIRVSAPVEIRANVQYQEYSGVL